MFTASLRHGFGNILKFSGRSSPSQFWPYALTLCGAAFVGWIAIFIPQIAGSMSKLQRFAAEHPDQATVSQGPAGFSIEVRGYHPELMPDFGVMLSALGMLCAIFVVLVVAVTVRRLHDSNRTGLWVLPPLVFLAIGIFGMMRLMARFGSGTEPNFSLFGVLFINNLAYLATLALLIVKLARSGTPGDNRYGPHPSA